MKRLLWTIPVLMLLGVWLLSGYDYFLQNALYPSLPGGSWSYTGSLQSSNHANGGGLTGQGVMLWTGANTVGEIKITLPSASAGDKFKIYYGASTDTTYNGTAGTYYVHEIECGAQYYPATLSYKKRENGITTLLASTVMESCEDFYIPSHPYGEVWTLRVVHRIVNGTLYSRVYYGQGDGWAYDLLMSYDSAPMLSGYTGIGVQTLNGGRITTANLGEPDVLPPSTISNSNIGKSIYSNHVDLQWPAATDNGTVPSSGLFNYEIWRNGAKIGSTNPGYRYFSDASVAPGLTYNYELRPVDHHGNYSSTAFTVTTAIVQTSGPFPSATPEGRRVGVRSTGAYWGAGGENIDVLSSNLNFTLPILSAMARGGWGAGFSLSYNSQNWRNDTGGNWKYGKDVGYGFGWKLMAGSLTPVYSNPFTVSHYLFLDSTGAEYRLDQNTGGVWSSKESAYVYFKKSQNRLYFRDGSFWDFYCVSASGEQDAGVMYPTLMQDSNGNQISIRYMAAAGWDNSSARISRIEDVRAVDQYPSSGYATYIFNYNSDYPLPHLASITNSIGNASHSFTYLTNQGLASPFNSESFPNTTFLRKAYATQASALFHEFSYNGSGELTQVLLPYKGKLTYDYSTATYSNAQVTKFREIQNRYLWKDGTTSTQYSFSHEGSPGPAIHAYTQLNDPGGVGQKYWEFGQSGISMGLVTKYEGRQLAGPVVKVRNDFTWVQDAAQKNSYIGTVTKTADPTQTYEAISKTAQTVDNYGNVTQVKHFNYGDLVNAYHTSDYTYLSNSPYTSRYILNRMLTGPGVTIAYDETNSQTSIPGVRQWDSAMSGVTERGNPSTITALGAPVKTINYNVLGRVTSTSSNGITSYITLDSGTNYTVPAQMTTGSFTTTATYNSFLGVTNETGPNGVSASIAYDGLARPASTTSPLGATTTYSYNTSTYPFSTTVTTNGKWAKATVDGLGRTVKTEAGQGGTTESVAEVEYDSCGCSPTGKVKKTSRPFAPGGTKIWTTYTYDGIGRTLTAFTDGTETDSTTTYLYEGNTVKVTDAAGKWKKYTSNVLGQLVQVNEPNPAGGADYITTYTYNYWGQLTGVSMPRPTGTQNRTWTYNSSRQLTSTTNPESGTVSFTYNSDKTLATKTDAKSQQFQYSYDSYKRVTQVRKYVSGTEQTCQREDYYFDTQSISSGFSSNTLGRLAAMQYKGGPSCNTTFQEVYSYNAPGEPTKKRLRVTRSGLTAMNLDATYTYNNEGQLTSTVYPKKWNGSAWVNTATINNVFDSMGRLQKVKEGSTDIISDATYNAAGQMTALTGGSGVPNESRTYNSIGQMTQLSSGSLSMQYNYSATQNNGKIVSDYDAVSGETVTYTYDALNRLASATSSDNPGWGQSFGYDGFGNNTTQTVTKGTAPSLNVTYNAATNRRTTDCADANGNLYVSPCAENYSYDVSNRLASAGGVSYSYSPSNQRVWRSAGDELTFYGATGQKLITYSLGTSGSFLVATSTGTYYYFGGKLIKNAGGYVTPDRLGSHGKYFPYGQERPSATGNNKEKFATYYRDSETGLDYANNRYHQPGHGRFLTPDPFGGSASTANPGSWNRYAYVEGDPVNSNDPSGLFPWDWFFGSNEFGGGYVDLGCWTTFYSCTTGWVDFGGPMTAQCLMYGLAPTCVEWDVYLNAVYGNNLQDTSWIDDSIGGFPSGQRTETTLRMNQLQSAVSHLSDGCRTWLTGAGVDVDQLSKVELEFTNINDIGNNVTVGQMMGTSDSRTIRDYLGAAQAAVLPDADGLPSNQVILTGSFDGYVPNFRDAMLTHEAIHRVIRGDDIALARAFGVYTVGMTDSAASAASNRALEEKCFK